MNEVLAQLLSQYTASSPHLPPHAPPGIHVSAIPLQIRNLAQPAHFLAIPDLDLDMNLDSTAAAGAPLLSAATWLPFSAPHLDRDDELNISSLSSDSDEDFEHSEDELASDDASDAVDDAGEGFGDNEDANPARSELLEQIMLAQRLLLSSARQNPTNRNTLITPEELRADMQSNRNHGALRPLLSSAGGVPLRRQNALRAKHRPLSARQLEERAASLHADFADAINAIRNVEDFVGKSPLFSSHPHSRCNMRKWGSRRTPRRMGLEHAMDRFLLGRRRNKLWPETAEPCTEKNDEAEPQLRREDSKRRKDEAVSPKKRRKVKPTASDFLATPLVGSNIHADLLSRADKYSILDGPPCSYFKSGSTFQLGLVADWLLRRGRDSLDVTFSNVDHSDKTLEGFFSVEASPDRSGDLHLSLSFLQFLCGGPRASYLVNCANRVVQTKFSLLNDTFMAVVVDRGLSNPDVLLCLTSALRIPFTGNIVDFNRHDLRFLPDTKPLSARPCFSRAMHVLRVRNELIKLQLGEWLRIRPFHNFSEAFFLNYLFFVENYLRDFRSTPKQDQELGVEFAQHLQDLLYDIAKNFSFVEQAKVPMAEEKFAKARREVWERKRREPISHFQKSGFLKEWDSKLAEKLCEYVTCEDTCLLNIQLNYVLFTVRVDVSAAIDEVFFRFLRLVTKDSERKTIERKYNELRKIPLAPENKDTVFVCLLNRKTGLLEMQNTRLYVDYKYAGTCDARSSLSRSVFSGSFENHSESDDDDIGPSVASGKYLEDPYLMGNPTLVAGAWKRSSPLSCSCSGGNGNYSFV